MGNENGQKPAGSQAWRNIGRAPSDMMERHGHNVFAVDR